MLDNPKSHTVYMVNLNLNKNLQVSKKEQNVSIKGQTDREKVIGPLKFI